MIRATRHIGIVVRDLEKNIIFWRDIMGLKTIRERHSEGTFLDKLLGISGVALNAAVLQAPDGSLVELLKFEGCIQGKDKRMNISDTGIRHIAFTVDDSRKLYETLVSAGCGTVSEPMESPYDKVIVFFARDPENNILEIVEIVE